MAASLKKKRARKGMGSEKKPAKDSETSTSTKKRKTRRRRENCRPHAGRERESFDGERVRAASPFFILLALSGKSWQRKGERRAQVEIGKGRPCLFFSKPALFRRAQSGEGRQGEEEERREARDGPAALLLIRSNPSAATHGPLRPKSVNDV